jgi:DNA-binding CsgD family transcriptional regulator
MTPPEAVDDAARRSLLAAECHLDSGELDRARGILEDLATRLATGPTRGVVLQRLGWVRYHQDSWPAATDLYAAAATESKEDPNLLAAIALDSSSALLLAGDVPGAGRAAQEAFDRAAKLDDARLLSDASAMVASVDFLLGRGLDEAGMVSSVERETWTRPRPTMQHPTVAFGVLLKWAGGLDRAHELLATAKRRAEEQGTERSLPFILFHLAELECWIGDWAAAEEHVRSAMTLAEATRQEGARAFALAAWALLASLRGLEAEVRQAAADGFEAARLAGAVPATLMLESVLGFLELSLGNPARAHRHLAPLVESAVRTGISEPGAIRFLGDGIEAMIGIGDTEPASAIVEHLMERSRELDRVWGLVVAGRCLGLLRSASGDAGGAEAALQRALEESQRLHQPLERGRTLLALGVVRRRDRQKRPARDVLEQGRAIFEELGADLWAQRASAELGRIGGRATSSVALTPTEERVARMVADGATNQEAASTLFLSVKTVEWNLSRVYRKLGIRSRTELVRWMGDNATAGH